MPHRFSSAGVLSLLALRDDVVPVAASKELPALVGGDQVDEVIVSGGHASLVVGRVAAQHVTPQIAGWLRSQSHHRGESACE